MIQFIIEAFAQNGPTVLGFVCLAWWGKRRMDQCEERCARELERVMALLPPGEQPTITYEEPPVLVLDTPVEPPAPLPVARALKA
jgi:hypothetical protein